MIPPEMPGAVARSSQEVAFRPAGGKRIAGPETRSLFRELVTIEPKARLAAVAFDAQPFIFLSAELSDII